MEYHFDIPVSRRNTGSMKWNVAKGELPMWVADMDFQTAPEITEVLKKRAEHGIFGYTEVNDRWYEAYQGWWDRRHGLKMEKEWLIFCTGVVPAISSAVRKLTTPGENVLIQTPVYNIFFNSIVNNGRNVLESPLKYDGMEYRIDWMDLEGKLSDPQTTLMLLCNPHNPVGKIWDRETLVRIGEICCRHHVTVISDEIHCDLTEPGKSYVPFAAASETCRDISVTCIAPTKAFNLAGIQTAAVMAAEPNLRHKIWRALNTDEAAEPNVFAAEAAAAAFTKGEAWLDQLREYLWENRRFSETYIDSYLPRLRAVGADATYLMWLDCRELIGCSQELAAYLRRETGLCLSEGSQYGKAGQGFLRLNLACPRELLTEGLKRLKTGVEGYERWAEGQC